MATPSETTTQKSAAIATLKTPVGKLVKTTLGLKQKSALSSLMASRLKIMPDVKTQLTKIKTKEEESSAAVPVTSSENEQRAIPAAPGVNPFKDLPYPSPGDRIKADDFKKLSQCLAVMHDMNALSSALFGHCFGDVRAALGFQQYTIEQVMTVFGTELDNFENGSFDNRKIIQVMPVELGENRLLVILSEAVETKRLTPNLIGLTYSDASEKLRSLMGDLTFPKTEFEVTSLVGQSLTEAAKLLS